MNRLSLTLIFCFFFSFGRSQTTQPLSLALKSIAELPQPFLFSVNTLTSSAPSWSVNYSGSYGERTTGPFGFDGVGQQLAIKGYLGKRFTILANASVGFAHSGGVTSAQQAEVIRDLIGGKQPLGPRFGVGLGLSRDWDNTKSLFSRITASLDASKWRLGGNLRFEKAFDKNRDNIDLVTSIGFHHHIFGRMYTGIEAVGQDLEGFWEKDEAEGGAKLLIGPSINIMPGKSRFAFSACGGPVFYATRSNVMPSGAVRDISSASSLNGYSIRAMVSFNLVK